MFGSLFILPVGEQIFSECLNGAQHGEGPNKKSLSYPCHLLALLGYVSCMRVAFTKQNIECTFQEHFRKF